MTPAPFAYVSAGSLEQTFDLARYGDEARVLADGQNLIMTPNLLPVRAGASDRHQ